MSTLRIRTARVLGLAAAALALTGATAAAQGDLPPARQVLDRYVAAIGGKAAFAAHQSRHMVAEMSMPAAGMTFTMETMAARPNKMLMKMTSPALSMTSGYDGTVAWSINPMQGPRVLTGAELAQTIRQADFDASADPARHFSTVETVGRGEVGGRPCWQVRMVAATNDEVVSCFDTETGLLLGSTVKAQTAMGNMESTIVFSGYRDFGGVKMPATTTTSVAGSRWC